MKDHSQMLLDTISGHLSTLNQTNG